MPRLKDFAGDWRLTRSIEDRLAGRQGRLEGAASFKPVPGGLLYRETGLLAWPGQTPLHAERSYQWRAAEGGILVCFTDGRAFHEFDPGETEPEARHLCDPDNYQVAYDFAAWPQWSATWTVTGPRKDYTLQSVYRRPGP